METDLPRCSGIQNSPSRSELICVILWLISVLRLGLVFPLYGLCVRHPGGRRIPRFPLESCRPRILL